MMAIVMFSNLTPRKWKWLQCCIALTQKPHPARLHAAEAPWAACDVLGDAGLMVKVLDVVALGRREGKGKSHPDFEEPSLSCSGALPVLLGRAPLPSFMSCSRTACTRTLDVFELGIAQQSLILTLPRSHCTLQ